MNKKTKNPKNEVLAERNLKGFIKKTEQKFKKYLAAYGWRKYKENYSVNIIIDDRDVMRMEKADLRKRINDIFKQFLKTSKNIKAKVVFVSDLNESNIWSILGNYAVISNVRITSSFVNIKLPNNFLRVYKKLPERFKLSDFEREIVKISKKKYHRNTYQNWLKSLKKAGFLRLRDKTYQKIEEPYKKTLLNSFQIKNMRED